MSKEQQSLLYFNVDTVILRVHFVSSFNIITVSMVQLSTNKGNQRHVQMFR